MTIEQRMTRCPRCGWLTTGEGACGTCRRELGLEPTSDLTDLMDARVRKEQGLAWMRREGAIGTTPRDP